MRQDIILEFTRILYFINMDIRKTTSPLDGQRRLLQQDLSLHDEIRKIQTMDIVQMPVISGSPGSTLSLPGREKIPVELVTPINSQSLYLLRLLLQEVQQGLAIILLLILRIQLITRPPLLELRNQLLQGTQRYSPAISRNRIWQSASSKIVKSAKRSE